MSDTGPIQDPSSIQTYMDTFHYLAASFAASVLAVDVRGMVETGSACGQHAGKMLFAGNDPKHLDFLYS